MTDAAYSLRALRRTPAFTIGAIATLALAIGANAAIFSVVRAVLLRQLPFREAEAVFWMWSDQPGRDRAPFNVPDFADYRKQSRTLEGLAGFFGASVNVSEGDTTERIQGLRATGNAFEVLGAGAAAGRLLQADDEQPGRERVVVLGHAFWKRRFGGEPAVVGRTIRLDGESHTIVGVLPADFATPVRDVDFVTPFVLDADPRRGARNSVSFILGAARLRRGVTRAQAEADLTSVARRLQQQFPVENARKRGVRLVGALEGVVGDFRTTLLALFGAVASVLLIACANLANLTLGRSAARRKEIAVRLALGSPRARIVGQVLTETVLLSAAGGVLGLLLARWAAALLLRLAPADLPRIADVRVDALVVLYSLAVSLLTGVVFGALPAFRAAKLDPGGALRAGGRGSTESARGVRNGLVAAEVGLAFVLLIVVGLFGKSFTTVQAVAPGFEAQGTLSARLALPRARYDNPAAIARFQASLEERLRALPAVTHAGTVSLLPLSGLSARVPFTVEGRPVERQHVPLAQIRFVSPGYFEAMRIPVRRGRTFSEHDREGAAPVAVVNDALAERWLAPAGGPMGIRLLVDDNDGAPRPIEVVGVVGDVRQMTLDGEGTLDLYLPYPQIHRDTADLAAGNMYLVVRASGEPMALGAALAREVRGLDADVAAAGVRPLGSYLAGSLAPRRFSLTLLSVFGAGALLLAAAGIYAVVSHSVGQRAREIAIRMALGATSADIQRLVVGQGVRSAVLGVVVAVPAALVVTRGLAATLVGVTPADPATFAQVALVLVAVAAGACAIPAARATRIRVSLGAE